VRYRLQSLTNATVKRVSWFKLPLVQPDVDAKTREMPREFPNEGLIRVAMAKEYLSLLLGHWLPLHNEMLVVRMMRMRLGYAA
jgi:hypothetical protein